MKIKDMRKEYLVVIIVGLIVVAIVFSLLLQSALTRVWYELMASQECMNNKRSIYDNEYVPGRIVVRFREGVQESEAKGVLKKFGLNEVSCTSMNCVVTVPEGNEFKWLCIIENSARVERTSLGHKTK